MPFIIKPEVVGPRTEKFCQNKGITQIQAGRLIRGVFNYKQRVSDHGDGIVQQIFKGDFSAKMFEDMKMIEIAKLLAKALGANYNYLTGRENEQEDTYIEDLKEKAEENINEIVQQNIIESKGNNPLWTKISRIALREDLSDEHKANCITLILKNLDNNNCINFILGVNNNEAE